MKNEVLEILKNRRSIRKFKSEQIKEKELDDVLEAGIFAPSAMGTQATIIVAVQNPDTITKLDELNAKALNLEEIPHPYYGAPTIIIVFASKDSYVPVEDGSLVAGNLMNAAHAVGLGSCWIHRAKEMFESYAGKELLKEWGLSENMMGIASIALGYPNCPNPNAAPRKEGRILKII